MSQTLFWFLTAILGGVYSLFLLGGGRLRHLWVAAAFPVGVFLTSIVFGFHILFRIPLTVVGVGTCLAVVLAYGISSLFKQKRNCRDLFWLSLLLPTFFLIERVGGAILSYDSVVQALYPQALAFHQKVLPEMSEVFASWGSLLIGYFTVGDLFGVGFQYGYPQVILLAVFLTFVVIVYDWARRSGLRLDTAVYYTILLSVIVFGAYFMFWHLFYLHNNMTTTAYMLLFFYVATQLDNEDGIHLTVFCAAVFWGYCFARTETAIFGGLLFSVIFLSKGWPSYLSILKVFAIPAAWVLFWNINLLSIIGEGSEILKPSRIPFVVGPVLAGMLLLSWKHFKRESWMSQKIFPYAPLIACLFFAAVFFLFWAVKPAHMTKSIVSLLTNFHLYWGGIWTAGAVILSLFAIKKDGRFFFYTVFAVLCLMLSLSFFRDPFRVSWADSANRMSSGIYLIMWWAVAKITITRTRRLLQRSRSEENIAV